MPKKQAPVKTPEELEAERVAAEKEAIKADQILPSREQTTFRQLVVRYCCPGWPSALYVRIAAPCQAHVPL
jgi:hypothetical protein